MDHNGYEAYEDYIKSQNSQRLEGIQRKEIKVMRRPWFAGERVKKLWCTAGVHIVYHTRKEWAVSEEYSLKEDAEIVYSCPREV